jgi:hypothetical protein
VDLKDIGLEGIDGIHVVHDCDRWRAIVNIVMNFQVT